MTTRILLLGSFLSVLVSACGTTTVRVVETEDPNDPAGSSGSSGSSGKSSVGGGGTSGGANGTNGTSGGGTIGGKDAGGTCVDNDPSCRNPCATFAPPAPKPNAAKVAFACNASQVDTLAYACAVAPESAGCATARADVLNKTCADCIFGTKNDPTTKMITLDPNGTPPAKYNQAGCIDFASGVPGCGDSYFTVVTCFDTFCADCAPGANMEQCQKDVAQGATGECKSYLISAQCATALDTAESKCFPLAQDDTSIQMLFRNMAAQFCQ